MTLHRNPEKPGVITGLVLIVVGIAMMVVPGLLGMEGMDGGFALGFAGLFLLIVGLVVAAVYWRRAATARRILAGENWLVHWTYEPDEWRRYAEQEFSLDTREKRGLYWLVVGIMVVIGLVFIIADPEAGIWVAALLAGVALLLAFFAFGMPRLAHRRRLRVAGEAIIATEGVYLAGSLHVFQQLGSRLANVSIIGQDPAMIEFQIAAPTQTGTQVYPVRVPIPRGQEEVAQRLMDHLAGYDESRD